MPVVQLLLHCSDFRLTVIASDTDDQGTHDMTTTQVKYQIYSNAGVAGYHTPGPVGKPYANAKRARTRAEKLNLEYGAYRYTVRPVDVAAAAPAPTQAAPLTPAPKPQGKRKPLASAVAWKTAKPYRAPPPPQVNMCKRLRVNTHYEQTVSYAGVVTLDGQKDRAASLSDVISRAQEDANKTGEPADIVRVYVLRGKGQCANPRGQDFADCAERYLPVAHNWGHTHKDSRLPIGLPNTGVVYMYTLTVYPEQDPAS